MVQVPTGRAALRKLMLPDKAAAVTAPPHVLVTLGVLATTRLPGTVPTFVGRLSVKLALIGTMFALVIEKVMVLTVVPDPPVAWIVCGLKLFVMDGGCRMMIPALAVPPLEAPKPAALAVYVNVVAVGVERMANS